jgi:acyl carrier protein
MKLRDFINLLAEILEVDDQNLSKDINLLEQEGYDSLARLAIIAMVRDKFQVQLTGDNMKKVTTINSLIEIIGKERIE